MQRCSKIYYKNAKYCHNGQSYDSKHSKTHTYEINNVLLPFLVAKRQPKSRGCDNKVLIYMVISGYFGDDFLDKMKMYRARLAAGT